MPFWRCTSVSLRGDTNQSKRGVISVNGAAAHKAQVGDLLIIASYASYNESEVKNYTPTLCYVDANNVCLSGVVQAYR
jgi:aspartate 1-decarboxylase